MPLDKKILSIDFDDDNNDYKAFSEFLEDDIQRKKKQAISEIENLGELYLKEIDRKSKKNALKAKKLIHYILRHGDDKYSEEELLTFSLKDVTDIYNQIKLEKRPFIVKILNFLFNIE